MKGAQPSRPTRFAPLASFRFFEGLITQQSPFGGGMASHLEIDYYGPRNNKLIDGLNTEVSSYLTMIRRPGNSVYNSQTFPAINRFYPNRLSIYNGTQTAASETIQVIADTATTVYDATGPNTKTALFTKTAGAGKTFFQSVGNTLYFSDGPDQKKYLTPSKIWAADQMFDPGDLILDSNGNIQEVLPSYSLNISTIQVLRVEFSRPPEIWFSWVVIVTFTSDVPWSTGTNLLFNGLTNYTALNGQTLPTISNPHVVLAPNQVMVASPTTVPYGPTADTGTASSDGNGSVTTGGTEPAWNVTLGGTTTDGQIVWQNFGKPIYNWGLATPPSAPSLTPNPNNRQWQVNTTYPQNYSILDINNNVQIANVPATMPGVSGNTVPTWNTVTPSLTVGPSGTIITSPGGNTADGNIVWFNAGPALNWLPFTNYPLGCVVLDSNGNWQILESVSAGNNYGTTGASAPAWSTVLGNTTTDADITWKNVGPGSVILTNSVQYAFSFHSIDGSVSTASPLVTQNVGSFVVGSSGAYRAFLFGPNSTDPQVDQIWIWRTVQGGSQLLFLDAIPNPSIGAAASWQYTDYLPDTSLNDEIEAPISDQNNPPPAGLTAISYHLGRIGGFVGNAFYYSDGPDVAGDGNGNTAWDPENVFIFPSTGIRAFPTSYGWIIITMSGIFIIQGLGTASSPLYSTPYLENIGLVSYDAFDVNGSICYLYTSDNQVIALDPNGGVSEVGFPIGDQFGPQLGTGTFNPSSAMVSWHVAGSVDKGLYVSDSTGTWYRMCPTPAPETGIVWSPRAQPIGGFSAVQSVEVVPGTRNLLLGPASSGPILKRDQTVWTDNETAYNAYCILGSIVLAQPGQHALVGFITTEAQKVGVSLTLAVQLDEIAPLSAGLFESLTSENFLTPGVLIPDPPTLVEPTSLYSQRFYLSQTQDPAWCRHLQIQVLFGENTVKNELLSLTIYGGFEAEY